jgi:hypothetical protein
MIFSTRNYSRLKLRLSRKYDSLLKKQLKEFNSLPSSHLGRWFDRHHLELKTYSQVKWYFLKQTENYLFITKSLSSLSANPEEFSKYDDVIFEKWNQSEFADVFLKRLNLGMSIKDSSKFALKDFEQHLICLGERHLFLREKCHPYYRVQNSLGEINKKKVPTRLTLGTLHLPEKDLKLFSHSKKESRDQSDKIQRALLVIHEFAPEAWNRFKSFTDVIIPIKQQEFVSFSHQELPGYSMINLYNRDFVDLMDDLLHENGHHHLNYYLNLSKIIEEPSDLIYYSPWRRTLRPLRGIYHAYVTFFWAFDLFSSLASTKNLKSPYYEFSYQEKEKIYWRAVEEFWMLDYTYRDLVKAKKQGLISEVGWSFVQEQRKILLRYRNKIVLWEKKLLSFKDQLKDLKKTLKSSTNLYQK